MPSDLGQLIASTQLYVSLSFGQWVSSVWGLLQAWCAKNTMRSWDPTWDPQVSCAKHVLQPFEPFPLTPVHPFLKINALWLKLLCGLHRKSLRRRRTVSRRNSHTGREGLGTQLCDVLHSKQGSQEGPELVGDSVVWVWVYLVILLVRQFEVSCLQSCI